MYFYFNESIKQFEGTDIFKVEQFGKFDILNKIWTYEKVDKIFYGTIKTIDFNNILFMFKDDKNKQTKQNKICQNKINVQIDESKLISIDILNEIENDILKIKGFDNNFDWFKMRVYLKSAFGENSRQLFHNWSKQWENYNFEDCDKEFNRVDCVLDSRMSLNILKNKIKNDFIDLEKFSKKDYSNHFFELNKYNYKISNKVLYEKNKFNVWIETKEKDFSNKLNTIGDFVENDLFNNYKDSKISLLEIEKAYNKNLENNEELEKLKEEEKKLFSNLDKFRIKILESSFCSSISKYLNEKFIDNDFVNKLNQNSYLFAFNDKVFDMKEMKIRDIKPDDYISITTGYNYPIEKDKEIENHIINFLKEIVNLKKDIFENEKDNENLDYSNLECDEIYKLLIGQISLCLFGENTNNYFNIWTGKGGNGKSVLQTLIEKTFGEYYGILDPSYIQNEKKNRNEHDTGLHQIKNCRLVCITEPANECEMKEGIIKRLTGNETITTREIGCKNEDWIPQFKIFFLVNQMPKFNMSESVCRRLLPLRFPYMFVNSDRMNEKNIYFKPIDLTLSETFKTDIYRDTFILMLIEHYKNNFKINKSIKSPQIIQSFKKEFVNEGIDEEIDWINENFEYVSDSKNRIAINELFNKYKLHYMNKYEMKTYEKSIKSFSQILSNSQFQKKRFNQGMYLLNIQEKEQEQKSEQKKYLFK